MTKKKALTRRKFLKHSAVSAGVFGFAGMLWAKGSDIIKVGLVGCGRRGSGAARDCIKSSEGVQVVALADAFPEKIEKLSEEFKVAKNRCFAGLDGYKELMALDDVDMVILATPPGFRPKQFTEAIDRGKHVFMEKPAAVCPAGIKMVIEAAGKADEKKLAVAAGTQRRHQKAYIETIKRIHDGAIGDILTAQCYWNQGGLWSYNREAGQSDIEWQLRNWLYFTWLSGDHIVEQHVHNIDVINWAFNALPDSVNALGGRQFRIGPEYGNIYDHFGVEFIYPNDIRTISMCRQIEGTSRLVGERVVGTRGVSDCAGIIEGAKPWRYEGPAANPFVQEHTDLINSIREGKPLNEGRQVAESTLCAIMARESAYTRQQFKRSWFMTRCTLNLLPPDGLKLKDIKPVDAVAVPGVYQLAGLQQEDTSKDKTRKKEKKKKK